MLRLIGMNKDEAPGVGSGSSVTPRVQQLEKHGMSNQFQIVHETANGGAVYGAAENTALQSGTYYAARSTVPTKYLQGSFKLTLQAIYGTRDKEEAIVSEVVQNAMSAVHKMHFNLNGMMVGKAHAVGAQQIAVVNGAVSAATTVTVDNGGTAETPPTQFIEQGDLLTIGTAAEILAGTGVDCEVASVTSDTVFETTAAVTLVDNDIVVRRGVYDATNSVFNEITGLDSLVNNTGTVQGINKATAAWFQSQVTGSAGTLTVNQILNLQAKARRYSQNPQNMVLIGNFVQWLRYSSLLTTQKTYDADKFAGNLAGGVQGLQVYAPDGGLPFFVDDSVPDGYIYVVDPDGYVWGELMPFDFVPDNLMMEGYAGSREVGFTRYEFAFALMGNLGQKNARSSGKITGITGPSV